MSTYLALGETLHQRLDKALENAGVPRTSFPILKSFLDRIGDGIYRGGSVFIKIARLCVRLDRCEKTIRTWLDYLARAGILSKRQAGPKGLEIQIQPEFLRFKSRSEQTLDPRRELAIDWRIEEEGDNVRNLVGFRNHLRREMSEEEVEAALARREAALAPRVPVIVEAVVEVLDEEPSESEEDSVDEADELTEETPVVSEAEINEAAQWRVEEKQKTPGFTGFIRGARSYFEATRRKLRQNPDQVPEIIERKKAAEEKALQEEEKRRRAAELAAEEAARAREETERRKALLEAFKKRPEEERRKLSEQAEARLPRNLRSLRADHPARIKRLERELLKLLESETSPPERPRDLAAELALRRSRKRMALEPG